MNRPRKIKVLAGVIVCLITCINPLSGIAKNATGQEWSCRADTKTGGWVCDSIEKSAGPYPHVPTPPAKYKPLGRKSVLEPEATAVAGTDAEDTGADAVVLGWEPTENLTEEQRAQVPEYCSGAYIEPTNQGPESTMEPGDAPLRASAASSELEEDGTAMLHKDVQIYQGYRQVKAAQAKLYQKTGEVELNDNVEIHEPGLSLIGNNATLNTGSGEAQINAAQYVLRKSHARGTADSIRRNADKTYTAKGSTYTHCAPNSNAWQLAAKRIDLDREEGVGRARGAKLRVSGVPIAYMPYVEFPLDDRRRTGFLWPSVSNLSNGGLDVAVPYYLNLAPNYDATLTPRYIADRGSMLEAEARYMNRWSHWTFSGSQLSDDDELQEDRWAYGVKEYGSFNPYWSSRIDYTRVSDDDYFNDLGVVGLDMRRETHLNQLGELRFIGEAWQFQTLVEEFQELDEDLEDAYKKLPRFELLYNPLKKPFTPSLSLESQYTDFDHQDSGMAGNNDDGNTVLETGQRVYLAPGISFPMYWQSGYITPTAKVMHVNYELENTLPGADDNPSISAPLFSLDAGLWFERDISWFGRAMQQTLEPRLFYLYVDDEDHEDIPNFDSSELTFSYDQLFRESRFSGHDRLADTDRLAMSLRTGFLDDRSGREIFSASIGQIFYFDDRDVRIDNTLGQPESVSDSDIAAELTFQPYDTTSLVSTFLYDAHNGGLNEGGLFYHYQGAANKLFNAGYRYRRRALYEDPTLDPTIDQFDVSGIMPLSTTVNLVSRWQFDLDNSRPIEEMLGFEYNNCCWALRVIYQRGLNNDNEHEDGVYMQFYLKGLGGLGAQIQHILEDSIYGYGDIEDTIF